VRKKERGEEAEKEKEEQSGKRLIQGRRKMTIVRRQYYTEE